MEGQYENPLATFFYRESTAEPLTPRINQGEQITSEVEQPGPVKYLSLAASVCAGGVLRPSSPATGLHEARCPKELVYQLPVKGGDGGVVCGGYRESHGQNKILV